MWPNSCPKTPTQALNGASSRRMRLSFKRVLTRMTYLRFSLLRNNRDAIVGLAFSEVLIFARFTIILVLSSSGYFDSAAMKGIW